MNDTTMNRGRHWPLLALAALVACGDAVPMMTKNDVAMDEAARSAVDAQAAQYAIGAGAPMPPATPDAGPAESTPLRFEIQDPAGVAMLIRSGTAQVEVDSLDAAVGQVRGLADRLDGYVANVRLHAGQQPRTREAVLEVKVPAARFDEAVAGLDPIGRVEAMNVDVKDVGEEFTDITARLENARRLEQRLLEILRERTGELDDVLAVERELARVRQEIERYEGRLRYLQARVAVSTLAVSLHEPMPLLASAAGPEPIKQAVRRAWRNFVELVAGLIAVSGFVVPIAAAIAVVAWFVRRHRRRGTARTPAVAGENA